MTARSKSLLARARRLNRQYGVILLTIEGDPEIRKLGLGLRMASNRQAMIGQDHFEAHPDEPVKAFHARLRKIAQDRGARMVMLDHPSNVEPLKEGLPYPPAQTGAQLVGAEAPPTKN
jgi:hypothetical protein